MSTLIVGCGYLGRRVGRRLRERGERVLGTTRSKADELASLGIEPVGLDVLEGGEPLPEVERVVDCVGFDRAAGRSIREIYVDGLRRVLDRLPATVARLVYTSSTGVYGGEAGAWVDERTPPGPRTESGRACLEAEGVVEGFAADRPIAATVLRLAGLYGPGRIIRREPLRRGEPIAGDPEKVVNLVHIDDAAAAVVAALDRAGSDFLTVNVADDRPTTRRELYGLTARLMGAPEPRFVPAGESAREEADKRVSNRRMKEALGVVLAYPDINTGLPAALAAEGGG